MIILRITWHFFKRCVSDIIKLLFPIKEGCVLCEAYGGLQYSCNPRAIAEYLIDYCGGDYEVVFSFANPEDYNKIDGRIKRIKKNSLEAFLYINTAEFIISNIRLNDYGWGWRKRKGQKYIMTWHGSMGIKPIEFDVKECLSPSYMKKAEEDSKNIDLMLSDSIWFNELCRRAFHYYGYILESGMPRNDIFFNPEAVETMRAKVRHFYKIADDKKLLLYAPTFRKNKATDTYISRWDNILCALKDYYNEGFIVMIRLHPNMMKIVDASMLLTHKDMIDATAYPDMQELLCAADILMTDYSSSMIDFSLMGKPCFLYVPDEETYDRGFYFSISSLPFPIARNIKTLSEQIRNFDTDAYKTDVHKMLKEKFGHFQNGPSCPEVADWMSEHSVACQKV